MYTEFYGFREAPFNITPDPRFLFFSDKHREAFNHVLFGIRERKGFIQITGKDNYRAASKWTGLPLLQNPEQASTYGGASTIAAAFWADKGLNSVAEQQDEDVAIKAETRAINGSLLGLSERQAAIIRAQRIWS